MKTNVRKPGGGSQRPIRRPHTIGFRVTAKEYRRLMREKRPDENISECARRVLFSPGGPLAAQ